MRFKSKGSPEAAADRAREAARQRATFAPSFKNIHPCEPGARKVLDDADTRHKAAKEKPAPPKHKPHGWKARLAGIVKKGD